MSLRNVVDEYKQKAREILSVPYGIATEAQRSIIKIRMHGLMYSGSVKEFLDHSNQKTK